MTENKTDSKERVHKKKNQYELTAIDLRYLKVIDIIKGKNKNAGIKPYSDSAISIEISGNDRYFISKIRKSHRGVTTAQIENTAIKFNLDANCFIRDNVKIEYDPNSIDNKVVAKDNAQLNYGNGNINTVNGNDNKNHFGDNNYEEGSIKEQVLNVEKMFSNFECPPDIQKKWHTALDKIQQESTNLEDLIDKRTKSLKKIADLLTKETSNREKAEKERDWERGEKEKIKDKYITLLEKVN